MSLWQIAFGFLRKVQPIVAGFAREFLAYLIAAIPLVIIVPATMFYVGQFLAVELGIDATTETKFVFGSILVIPVIAILTTLMGGSETLLRKMIAFGRRVAGSR